MRDFSHSLPMALLRAREAVMARFRPLLAAHGVTEQQWRVLRALYEVDRADVSALAERCCLLMPSLSRILRTMEQTGLIARAADAGDARRSIVSITARGRALLKKVAPHSERQYVEIARRLGAKNLDDLYLLLERLAVSLDRAPPRRPR
jgi:homoprotocatechuate degradation regulator HpaR